MANLATPGGKRLRALREYRGKTQLDVELDASLGMGYLQRLELGRVKQPERDTVERILSALDARYTERREILELFGYIVDAPIPDADEIDWAIQVCQDDVNQAHFPMYLLDCSHRLLFWNACLPRLFHIPSLATVSATRQYATMLGIIFNPAYGTVSRIVNKDTFFAAQIRAFRYERQWFHDEPWYATLINDMLQFDVFKTYWENEKHKPIYIPARPLVPLQLQVADKQLCFRLIAEPFVQDRRFRMIFLLPDDVETAQQCQIWSGESVT